MKKEEEYKEIFLAEALDNHEELNRLLTELEKKPHSKSEVDAIFRITHTLKGNAAGMGFSSIAEMAHSTESLFGEIRDRHVQLNEDIFSAIFKAVDVLGNMIRGLKEDKQVNFKGIKTRLEVITRRLSEQPSSENQIAAPAEEYTREDETADNEQEEEAIAETKVVFSDLVQVPVRKLDNLLNLVGELIIERDRIMAFQNGRQARSEYARLNRISSDLQYSVMDVRMVQVGFLFNKFHRVVRDAAALEKKQVSLQLEGTDTEIDRNILQTISDSLIHLIRNAVAHGVESPEERKQEQKPAEGIISLKAYNENDTVIIEIKDDGKGIDLDKVRQKAINKGLVTKEGAAQLSEQETVLLIFEPGFSTVEQVNAISGRGVGMDVVKQAMDTIGGSISVETARGKGSTIKLELPASMVVKGTLLFELNKTEYAVPLTYTDTVFSLYKKDIHKVGGGLVALHQKKTISIVFLNDLFNSPQGKSTHKGPDLHYSFCQLHAESKLEVVVVSYGGKKIGFVVDKLLQQKEIVEKPLIKPVEKVKFVSGVTILGNGNVCLVLHIPAIIQEIFQLNTHAQSRNILS